MERNLKTKSTTNKNLTVTQASHVLQLGDGQAGIDTDAMDFTDLNDEYEFAKREELLRKVGQLIKNKKEAQNLAQKLIESGDDTDYFLPYFRYSGNIWCIGSNINK